MPPWLSRIPPLRLPPLRLRPPPSACAASGPYILSPRFFVLPFSSSLHARVPRPTKRVKNSRTGVELQLGWQAILPARRLRGKTWTRVRTDCRSGRNEPATRQNSSPPLCPGCRMAPGALAHPMRAASTPYHQHPHWGWVARAKNCGTCWLCIGIV